MKKILLAAFVLLALIPAQSAFALEYADVNVNNYFYAHANTPGTFEFKNKSGGNLLYGDGVEHDAEIVGVKIAVQGFSDGDRVEIISDTGEVTKVTISREVSLSANDYIQIKLIKSGTNEAFARVTTMWTMDDSNGGTYVTYNFDPAPTSYGDLGSGATDVSKVTGNYYYFEPRDAYKFDYTAPSGINYYELHYLFPDGSVQYNRTYNQSPTGVHYLTCNGTYQMQFFDASGGLVAQTDLMTTTAILNPACASYAGTGYSDFTPTVKPGASEGYKDITWDPVPGATSYDVYHDDDVIYPDLTPQANGSLGFSTPWPGAYTIVAKDPSGNIVGQADLTIPSDDGGDGGEEGGEGGSCDGCKLLTDMLACPAWDQYMGDMTQAIKNAWPDPPYWQGVANIMRDTIVPAIGQELVDRAPEIAEIIADEFESREDPVNPPVDIPTYSVPYDLPKPTDMPDKIPFDLNSNVPSFEPDYSESKSFTIPDPLNIQLDDQDKGYEPPSPSASPSAPIYQGSDPTPEPDIGYHGVDPGDGDADPGYQVSNPDATTPGKDYQMHETDGGTIPGYQGSTSDPGTVPSYETPNESMPDYQRGGT